MSLLLPIKQRITWSLFENDTTWRFWKGKWILRVHMYLLSWRKTNFLCITSILSPKSMSKLINVNCLHFIGCQNYINVLINRVLYQIQVTALLPFFLSILHLLLQLSKIMLWSTVKLLLAIVMSIIFGPLKTLPRSSKSCDCVTFRVLKIILWTSVEIWWYFVPRIFVKRNLSPSLLRWSSLQTKEGQRHTEFHLVGFENSQTPSTTTVWPSDHREDYRSCAWPLYSPVQTFPKALHSD